MIVQKTIAINLCFFVDGLDEFEGDHEEISTFFKTLQSAGNVKICLLSRPLVIFEQEFGNFSKVRLQELTVNDISRSLSLDITGRKVSSEGTDELRQDSEETARTSS